MREVRKMTDDELNAAVAVEVMGWEGIGFSMKSWSPATNIADAFEVVERMASKGWEHSHYSIDVRADPTQVEVEFWRPGKLGLAGKGLLPRAICEAALAAVRDEG